MQNKYQIKEQTEQQLNGLIQKNVIPQYNRSINDNLQFYNLTRNYGNMLPIGLDENNQPKYVIGPHYYILFSILMLCAWLLWYLIKIMICEMSVGIFWQITAIISAIFFLICYLKIGLSNPGIASSVILPEIYIQKDKKYCVKCRVLKINGIRHCYTCDLCILDMDHHCPWVGKCIGKNNIKLFKIFIFSALQTLSLFFIIFYQYTQYKGVYIQ